MAEDDMATLTQDFVSVQLPNHIHCQDTSQPQSPYLADHFSSIYTPAPAEASSRYNRQMLIPAISLQGQQKIAASRVLIIGLGGLGSPASLYLAGAGIGSLGLLDNDQVELSNLHRQVVHAEAAVKAGLSKVQSALQTCQSLNSTVNLVPHEMLLDVSDPNNARQVFEVFQSYDIVLDCTDNPATRYLISDLCVLLGKVLISGAAQKLEGQVTVLNYMQPDTTKRGPCYRCVFPIPPSPEMVKSCGEIGILGPVVGTIGTLMASEALRLIVKGSNEPRKPTMLMYNAWPTDPRSMFRTFGLRGRREDCMSCGDTESILNKGQTIITKDKILDGSLDYATFCGRTEPVKVLDHEHRISAREFVDQMLAPTTNGTTANRAMHHWYNPVVVDVREPHEIEMGSKLKESIAIPISRFLRQDSTIKELQESVTRNKNDAVLFVCQQGNDSQIAAKKLIDAMGQNLSGTGKEMTQNTRPGKEQLFIGDIVGGFTSLDKV